MIRLLLKEEITFLNKNNVSRFGGNFVPPNNFLHENYLDYLVEIVDAELFGEKMYPEIYQKASIYLYNIIANHIFSDGNKRTGLGAGLIFLKINGYQLKKSVTNPLLTNFILSVASGNESLETVQQWLKANSEKK